MKLYGPIISRALRCFWTADELGCEYERVNIDLMKGEHARPPFSDIAPLKKVPALVHGDLGHDVLHDYRKEHSRRPALQGLLEQA